MSLSATAAVLLLWAISQNGLAAQFLEQAQGSSRTMRASKSSALVYQKVRIRHGGQVIDRTVYHDAGRPAGMGFPDPEMKRALDSAHIRWEDPLSIDDFAAWRESQFAKWDTVAARFGRVELRTIALGQSPIREASLTVSQADWHPISRRVEFWDGAPVEVTEIASDIRDLTTETSMSGVPPIAPPPAKSVPVSEAVPVLPVSVPAESDVEESEIRLRTAFHSIGADVREVPEIWASGGRVFFRVIAEGQARKEEISRAAESIPLISEAGSSPERVAPGAAIASSAVQVTAPYSTNPPLAKALRARLGGIDETNRRLDLVRDAYFRLLAESVALERLGKRYSAETLDSLAPEARILVDRIANDHIEKIQLFAKGYFELLQPVWHAIRPAENSAALVDVAACSAWQKTSGLVSGDLRRSHLAFIRLFVRDQVEQPIELSAETLLAESDQAQKLLEVHLAGLCPAAR